MTPPRFRIDRAAEQLKEFGYPMIADSWVKHSIYLIRYDSYEALEKFAAECDVMVAELQST